MGGALLIVLRLYIIDIAHAPARRKFAALIQFSSNVMIVENHVVCSQVVPCRESSWGVS